MDPFEEGRKNLFIDLSSCFHADKMLSISVLLTSFHRRGRRSFYNRAVKMFDRKLSMLYVMLNIINLRYIAGLFFEQKAKMLS